ncbi:MAG: hypothetical protein HY682_07865, partial [Chloroflexi bacterium]|nr:hypothetical protein [Chloroflexota bacterium]
MANLALMVVAFAAFLAVVTSFALTWFQSAGAVAEGYRTSALQDIDVARSHIAEDVDCINPVGTSTSFVLVNDGTTPLRDFANWNVFAKYSTATTTRIATLEYATSTPLSADQWTVSDIKLRNGAAEVFQPDIIDTGEEATISASLSPGVYSSAKNSLVITTETGKTATVDLTGENECSFYLHNNPT